MSDSRTNPSSKEEPALEALGDCGKRSFNAGLRYCGLPDIALDLKTSDEIIELARTYGLDIYDHGRAYTARNEPVLVVYRDGQTATNSEYHAVFASDVAPWRLVWVLIAGWDELRARVSADSTGAMVGCTCLAAGNQVAWEYVHHANDCPVYAAGEAAKQWLLEHPNLKHSRIFAGAAAWDRETVATLLVQYATRFAYSPAVSRDEAASDVVLIDQEEAARAICSYCASYGPPEKDINLGWIHRGEEFSVNCEAYAIRSLASSS